MKLVRFGDPGQERPGIVDRQGHIRDVSNRVADWAGDALEPDRLAAFSAMDLSSFPLVPAGRRLGPPVPTPGRPRPAPDHESPQGSFRRLANRNPLHSKKSPAVVPPVAGIAHAFSIAMWCAEAHGCWIVGKPIHGHR